VRERARRLFNLRPGEERKTLLLYALNVVFYAGLTWGNSSSRALFVSAWGADALRYIFIADAFFSLLLGLVYTFFADRVGNARLLIILSLLILTGLVGVRILLETSTGGREVVYPLYLLLYRAFRPLLTLHLIAYVNDFYDTRAAKRALPLMMAASILGAALAGLVAQPLVGVFGAKNLTLGWVGCLVVVLGLVALGERQFGHERQTTTDYRPHSRRKGSLDNLRDGFNFVKGSSFLRLLAAATLAMAFMNNLFSVQTSWAIDLAHPDQEAQTIFYAVLDGVTNVVGLFIQMLLLGRVLAWLGVGVTNLIFPFTSLVSYSLLGLWPGLATAVGGYFNEAVLKRALRSPIDAMLYNAVPVQVKGRARAFINTMLVPLGVLFAGVLLFWVPEGASLPGLLVGLGIGVTLLYVWLSLRLRGEYSRALVSLLEEEEFALYRLASDDLSVPDAATLQKLVERLKSSPDDEFTIFLAELIAEVGGKPALPVLQELTHAPSPRVRAAALTILSDAGASPSELRRLYLRHLTDEAGLVRQAAIAALRRLAGPGDQEFLSGALSLLSDPDLDVQAQAMPSLIQSGDFFYQAAAVQSLSALLKSDDAQRRATGVRLLGTLGDARFIRTLTDYISDPDDMVRRAAALAIEQLTALEMPPWLVPQTRETARALLNDAVERVRLAGVTTLRQLGGPDAIHLLLVALSDNSRAIRERAAEALQSMGRPALPDLEAALENKALDIRQRETVSVVLARIERERFAPLVHRQIDDNLHTAYETLTALSALETLEQRPDDASVALLRATLVEYSDQRLERIFDLIASVHPPQAVHTVAGHLRSLSERVRANAVEALEALTSPHTALLIAALTRARTDGADILTLGADEWGIQSPTARQVFKRYSQSDDPWLQAVAVYALGHGGAALFGRDEIDELLERIGQETQNPDVQQACRAARHHLSDAALAACTRAEKEGAMLSTIERVIFLKQVPFFESMTIEQLRILASVSAEHTFDEDEVIFGEGDAGDALYIVVSGRVGIERTGRRKGAVVRLATLSNRQYFGEMSIFDEEPRSASAIALEPTLLLGLHRAPLLALARENPDLTLELLRVLSRRLREANQQIADKSRERPRQLEKLYDKLDSASQTKDE
jgi:CRP-like cAMP-binding protein/HEAT repeat protein